GRAWRQRGLIYAIGGADSGAVARVADPGSPSPRCDADRRWRATVTGGERGATPPARRRETGRRGDLTLGSMAVPLAPLTTLGLGGPAPRVDAAASVDELACLLAAAEDDGGAL